VSGWREEQARHRAIAHRYPDTIYGQCSATAAATLGDVIEEVLAFFPDAKAELEELERTG
jgi:hypothetical protein